MLDQRYITYNLQESESLGLCSRTPVDLTPLAVELMVLVCGVGYSYARACRHCASEQSDSCASSGRGAARWEMCVQSKLAALSLFRRPGSLIVRPDQAQVGSALLKLRLVSLQ